MRVALLCTEQFPRIVARGGGDVRRWQALAALTALGHEVHLIVTDPRGTIEPEVERLASSVAIVRSDALPRFTPRWLVQRAFNPETLGLRAPDLRGTRSKVLAALDAIRPDLVWCEEQHAVAAVRGVYPYVFSHLDFMFKLREVRRGTQHGRLLRRPDALSIPALKKIEYRLAREALATVCASETEAQMIRDHGLPAVCIPIVGPTIPRPDTSKLSPGRILLIGNSNTAMRSARQHLRTELWPMLEAAGVRAEWHQVGEPPRPDAEPKWSWFEERFQIHGFVQDLGSVMSFGDASIMPYRHDTGGRTKYGVACGYGVVNIAYRQTFLCAPEFTPDVDCLAPSEPAEMVDAIRRFVSDERLRRDLAEGARALYERAFSFESTLPAFAAVVEGLKVPRQARSGAAAPHEPEMLA
jgi:glycosyltransferase involved in cell wall biosynthesis